MADAVGSYSCSTIGVKNIKLQHTATIPWALVSKPVLLVTPWFTNEDCFREDVFWRIGMDAWGHILHPFGPALIPSRCCWLQVASYDEMQSVKMNPHIILLNELNGVNLHLIPEEIAGTIEGRSADGTVKYFANLIDSASTTGYLKKNSKLSLGSFGMPPVSDLKYIDISVTIHLIRWEVEPTGAVSVDMTSCRCDVLRRMVKSRLLTDVELKCEGKSIHAHKAVLAARSPVFEAMFTKDFKEKEDGVISIEGLQPEALLVAVESLYGESLPSSCGSDMLADLLSVAERYQLQSLKNACEELLLKDTSQDV